MVEKVSVGNAIVIVEEKEFVMAVITLKENDRAVFPEELRQELGLSSGDELKVKNQMVNGNLYWVLERKEPDLSWIGSLRNHAAKNVEHSDQAFDQAITREIARNANA
jgi:bifunctional DNA-binding transcriptional regulator/antitoxin component of YhaV-PrlF toxin-antitoxin module